MVHQVYVGNYGFNSIINCATSMIARTFVIDPAIVAEDYVIFINRENKKRTMVRVIDSEKKSRMFFTKMLQNIPGDNTFLLKKMYDNYEKNMRNLTLKLDDEVFTDINVSCEMLKTLVRNYALTNKGIAFKFIYEDDCAEEMVFLYNNLSDRIAEHFKSKEVKTYNEYFKFEGEESGRTNSGSIDISIAFTEGEKLRESFCNGRFLQHEGIAVWSLEELIKNEIRKRFLDITNENKVIEEVLNNTSIIVNVEMKRYMEKWQSGFRAAITNPLVNETIKNRCQFMVEKMIDDNIVKIKEAGK